MVDEHGVDCVCEHCWGKDDPERREARVNAALEAQVQRPPTPHLDALLDAWGRTQAGLLQEDA